MPNTPSESFPSPKSDAIDPAHYRQGSVECIDAIESALGPAGFVAFLRGQVIKYNWRMGLKDAPLQEAQKAHWYQQRLVAALQKAEADLEKNAASMVAQLESNIKARNEQHERANAVRDAVNSGRPFAAAIDAIDAYNRQQRQAAADPGNGYDPRN